MRTRRLAVVVGFYSGCASCASATANASAIVSGCVVVISASITGCGMIWLSLRRRWRWRRQQHKQDVNNLLKKLPLPLLVLLLVAESWGVCGDSVVVVVTRDSCIDAASSSSICSVVINLLNASVWSLLNSIMDSIRFLTTPVSMSVCK